MTFLCTYYCNGPNCEVRVGLNRPEVPAKWQVAGPLHFCSKRCLDEAHENQEKLEKEMVLVKPPPGYDSRVSHERWSIRNGEAIEA